MEAQLPCHILKRACATQIVESIFLKEASPFSG